MEKATPRPPLSPADFPVDIVRLAASCGAEYGHALHVAALCEKLFGALDALHRFSDTEKKWLRCAALLHDIGWIDGQKKHHKNSLNRILEADLPSLSPEEKIVVGLLARYHRKALPKDSHPHFGSLSAARKDTVKKLAALLRLADGLDRTHAARIRELSCVLEKNRVRLLVTRAASFSETDLMTGKKKSDLFEEAFGKELRIEWSSEGRPA